MAIRATRIVDGKYRIGRVLGRGAMGTVYDATHVLTEVRVAIKLLPPSTASTPQGAERFRREVAIAARVPHPGIVKILDAGVDPADDTHYVVMEYLEGDDLRTLARTPGFTIRRAIATVRAALEPLAAAHAHGVVHRDIKPENIFIHRNAGDDTDHIKLLDFGIARDAEHGRSVTDADVALGTPHFMSPEQATSAHAVTPAADVWSVGVILYWVLAGRLPFQEDTAFNTLRAVCLEPAPPLRVEGGPTTQALADLVMRCLEKNADDRPATAAVLAAALDELFPSPLATLPTTTLDTPLTDRTAVEPLALATDVSSSRPQRGWLIVSALVLIAAAAYLAVAVMQQTPEAPLVAPVRRPVHTSAPLPRASIEPAERPPNDRTEADEAPTAANHSTDAAKNQREREPVRAAARRRPARKAARRPSVERRPDQSGAEDGRRTDEAPDRREGSPQVDVAADAPSTPGAAVEAASVADLALEAAPPEPEPDAGFAPPDSGAPDDTGPRIVAPKARVESKPDAGAPSPTNPFVTF